MAYTALTTSETASGKPFLQALARKIKDCLDYLYGLIGSSSSIGVPNGSFEIDADADGIPDAWTKNTYPGGTGAIYTTAPAHGAKSWSFTRTGPPDPADNGGGYLDSDYIEVTQLGTYWVSFIHWATAAGMRNKVQVRYFDKAKSELGSGSPADLYNSISNPTSATAFTSYCTPPATTRFIKVRLIGGFTDTNVAGTAYFDDVRFGLIANASVSQAKLKTSTGEVSATGDVGAESCVASAHTLPGGEYGFWPQVKKTAGNASAYVGFFAATATENATTQSASYVSLVGLFRQNVSAGGQTITVYAQQRYVTSSGEVFWLFLLRNKMTKEVAAASAAPDHPCFGNGGKPLLVPHPFGDYDETKHEIIVINPSLAEIEQMELETIVEDETKPDRSLLEVMLQDYEIDEESIPLWHEEEITVGLPRGDWKNAPGGSNVIPIKKKIPKPEYVLCRKLKRRGA